MLALAWALLALQAGEPTCRTADSRVEDLISSTAAELQGKEYCQFRLYHTIDDIDHDGKDDFLVVFAVEGLGGGGNNHVQYLAVFSSKSAWTSSTVRVGQRGVRNVNDVSVEDSTIVLSTSEQQRDDPLCCPSGKGELRYRFKDGQLLKVEVGRATTR